MEASTRSTQVAPRETELREFISEFNGTVSRVNDLRIRVAATSDRLVGSIPQNDKAEGPTPVPGSLMEELRSCLGRAQTLLGDCESSVSRIERAV